MITAAEVQRLRAVRAPRPSVLSLYLHVPAALPALRDLPARADDLLAEAAVSMDRPDAVIARGEQRRTVRRLLEAHARAWLGQTIAIFAAGDVGLARAFPLPFPVADRAVLAARPYVRPLLVALQRAPAYAVTVLGQRQAWVFRVTGAQIDVMVASATPGVRSTAFAGWLGLSRRTGQRITELACHRFDDTAASMKQALQADGWQPLVVGGQEDAIAAFLAVLSDDLRDRFAGSFAADPAALTPGRIRDLSAAVIESWVRQREQQAVAQILAEPSGGLTALGLDPCLAAVNSHAVKVLAVPADGLMPGFACELCGTLASSPTGCPHMVVTAHPVPDILEEMVATTLDDGGEVVAVHDPPAGVAARLRFPAVPATS
jgi:hypothetical protein